MENTNKQFEYGPTIKNLTKSIGMVFIVSLVTLAIFGVGLQMGGAKTEYQVLTPAAQKTYDLALKTLCNAEKTLAQAKLMDFTNNALKLDPESVKQLAVKRDMECAFNQAKAAKAETVIMKEQFAQPEVQSGLQGRVIEKYNIGEDKQKIIRYASMKSGNSMDFVTTLDVENEGSWDVNIKSHNKNGSYDLGLCQFNSTYFGYLHKDPNWNNPYWQIDRCWESYSEWAKRGILGKRFFGYNTRHRTTKNFHYVNLAERV